MFGSYDPLRDIPTIDTPRLTLRGHARADFGDCAAMWADPLVTRHIGGRPSSAEEVWARLLRYVGHWVVMGYGYWAVIEKSSHRFVGEVGFADFRRELNPPLGETPEVGWALAPWAHNKGMATEAVRGAIAWHDARFGLVETVCLIAPENLASIRVASKCGYVESERTTYKGGPTIIFARR